MENVDPLVVVSVQPTAVLSNLYRRNVESPALLTDDEGKIMLFDVMVGMIPPLPMIVSLLLLSFDTAINGSQVYTLPSLIIGGSITNSRIS